MINEKNASYLYVANVLNGVADDAIYDTMAKGSVCIVKAGTNCNEQSAMTGSVLHRVVQRKLDGTYVFSPYFSLASITGTQKHAVHVAPVEQTSFWGYDGTSNTTGFPTIVTGNTYSLHFILNHTRNTYNNAPQIKTVPYKAQSTSQADLALGLQQQFLRTFSETREFYPSIRCNRTADGTVAAMVTATIGKVTSGSTTVYVYTKTGDITSAVTASVASLTAGNVYSFPSSCGRTFTFDAVASVSHEIYIGDQFLSVASVSSNTTTQATNLAAAINAATTTVGSYCIATSSTATVTITYRDNFVGLPPMIIKDSAGTPLQVAVTMASGNSVPVKYKVAATTSAAASFELDVPWQGPSGYIYTGTGTSTTAGIGLATVTGYWGLKFTGIRQPFDPIVDSKVNQKVYFDITSEDFGTLTEYKAAVMNPGMGTYESVAYQEIYSQFLDKDVITSKRPRTKYRQEAIEGVPYNIYTFVSNSSVTYEAVGQNVGSKDRITIAINTGLTAELAYLITILTSTTS